VELCTSFDRLGRYAIEWSEHGGPPVKPHHTAVDFGSTVIERSIGHDLKGESRLEFLLTGLRAHFLIPAVCVVPAQEAQSTAVPAHDETPIGTASRATSSWWKTISSLPSTPRICCAKQA
jgi:hypothetical protein